MDKKFNKDIFYKASYPLGKGIGFNFLKWFIRVKRKESVALFSERYQIECWSKVIFNYRVTVRNTRIKK